MTDIIQAVQVAAAYSIGLARALTRPPAREETLRRDALADRRWEILREALWP